MSDVESVRVILRALAEVRDGPFYSLFIELRHHIQHPAPEIGFRIYRVADSAEVTLGVWVSAIRHDGAEVNWAVSLETVQGSFIVRGSVEISDDKGYEEVFVREADTQSCAEASELIREYASEVCAELKFVTDQAKNGDQLAES